MLKSKKKTSAKKEEAKASGPVVKTASVVESKKEEALGDIPKKGREILKLDPANGKAIISEDGQARKVVCYYRRRDLTPMLGVVGPKSVSAYDWKEGKNVA